jgi:hypothetical protein
MVESRWSQRLSVAASASRSTSRSVLQLPKTPMIAWLSSLGIRSVRPLHHSAGGSATSSTHREIIQCISARELTLPVPELRKNRMPPDSIKFMSLAFQ